MPPYSNVDPEEIRRFDRMAQLWWDPQGKLGMLHVIDPLRLRFITDHLQVRGTRGVDIGCGGGILTEALARSGARMLGIDQSDVTLAVARAHAASTGLDIDYRLTTIEELVSRESGTYDFVTCMEMLEHVPEPAAVVRACARLLKPGGHAVFSTINRTLKAWLFAIVGGEYILRLLPRGTHHYLKLVRPHELRAWGAASKLECLSLASLIYNPFTRRFRLAPGRVDVNYLACFRKRP